MTLEPYWCPVDDCEFGEGEEKTLQQVRSHINSTKGPNDSHEWETLKQQVLLQADADTGENTPTDPSADTRSDGGENDDQQESDREQREPAENTESDHPQKGVETGSDQPVEGGSSDDRAESPVEQPEPAENTQNDQQESTGNDEMATQEEYEDLHNDDEETEEQTGDGKSPANPESGDTGDETGKSDGFSIPSLGASTWLLIAGLLLAALIAWRLFGGDAASDYEAPEEQGEGSADGDDGQMLPQEAVDSGTGGVDV